MVIGYRRRELTEVEMGILKFTALGMTTTQIALVTHKSPITVQKQRVNIMWKLGAHTMAHAMLLAYREGILKL